MNTFLQRLGAICGLLLMTLLTLQTASAQTYTMSTGTVTTCSGTFYDNGGPSGNFSNGLNLTETFISSTGSRIRFDFTTMTNLNATSLKIYDGPTAAYPLIGTFGGTTFSVQSTGSALTFVFSGPSGSYSTFAGWEANISCTTASITPYTMTNGSVTACSGTFHDPAGPAANYPNSNVTTQTFSSGSSQYINFTFTNFDVALGDTLFAYDGTSITAPLIGKYTGTDLPEVISSRTGSSVTFRFVSSNSVNDLGWQALIGCSASPIIPTSYTMQNGVRTVCSGTFYDNGGPSNNFSNGLNLTETFISSTGSRIRFDFTTMTNLNATSLKIYDGPTAAYPLIGIFGGTTFSVQSTGSALTFVFSGPSGSYSTFAGWEANISCTTASITPYTMTNGSVTACSGTFHDPAGPAANYPNSNVTTQTFSSGSSQYINFTFTNFDVALGDTLFAYDGTSITAPLIGKYTGTDLPEVISSRTSSSVTFRFVSSNSVNDLGWQAIIGCSASPIIPTSYTMQNGVRTVCSGTFYDNGGPSNNFSNGLNLTETFISSTGSRIRFDFTTMTNLNATSLKIYDGPTAAYPLIGIFGGTTFSVQSTGSALTFVFSGPSGSYSTFAGWEANISCTTASITPYTMTNGSVTACSGTFHDPAGPAANYPNSNVTTQTFSSGSSQYINFTFTNFDVALGDTLFAYDGTSITAPLIGKYTGTDLPEVISSRTGSSVTFRFVSSNSVNDLGWQALIGCSASPIIPTSYTMQNGVRTVCSGTFYDNGGPSNNFSNGLNLTETFISSTGNHIRFDFTTMTSLNAASLKIYDGPTAAYPLIGIFGGTTFSVQSTGSALTFVFSGPSGSFSTFAGWEANISCVNVTSAPVADFSTPTYTVCSGSCLAFTDLSVNSPDSWNWQFQGASVSTSTLQNPTGICYNTAGTYTVSLTASNSLGLSSVTKTITVLGVPSLSISPSSASICQGESITLSASGASTYTWSTGSNSYSIAVSPISNSTYTVTGTNSNGCQTSLVRAVSVKTTPVISISGSSLACSGQSVTLSASGATTYTWNTGATSSSISVLPSGLTVYSVSGTGSNGCSSSATKTVNIGASPTVSIGGGNTALCAGNPVVLSASGATSYTWSTGSVAPTITVSPAANTNYTLTGNSGSCNGTAVKTVSVLTNPLVSITGNSLICSGQSASLTASGASTYSWNTSSTGNNIVVSPTITTGYTVTGTGANGCNAQSAFTVQVSPCTNIAGREIPDSDRVYPNPFQHQLIVELSQPSEIIVTNVLGVVCYSSKAKPGTLHIETSHLASGIYHVRIVQENAKVYKLVKP